MTRRRTRSTRRNTTSRPLLATTTGEPVIPVRLYYDLASEAGAARALDDLRCCDRDREHGGWVWLYHEEAVDLAFPTARSKMPPEIHPIVIGRLRLEPEHRLSITVRSTDRALAAARFFAPVLGKAATLRRMRIVNRLFDAREALADPAALDAYLDRGVTVVDPETAARAVEQVLEAAPPDPAARLAAVDRYLRERDTEVPMVEDFPLWPEEEDERFTQLALTLQFRAIHALERWFGNNLTLGEVIRKVVTGEPGLSVKVPPMPR